MPSTLSDAIEFLETQWSSINENKVKGILAELRFKNFLIKNEQHYVSGGWIMTPGKPTHCPIPTREKICILPRLHRFSWQGNAGQNALLTPAEISAYNYFRQLGVRTLFATPVSVNEGAFVLPSPSLKSKRALYPKPYDLELQELSPAGGFVSVAAADAFGKFPARNGNIGVRCHKTNRIDKIQAPWTQPDVVSDMFWFEYARYFFQLSYLLSNNDLDLFVIGQSGASYPVELKSKMSANDSTLGDWFGIDIGPYAKMSFFTSNSMNTDALYVVEEVDVNRNHIEWHGIKFTDLVKSCSWVGRAGGTGMMGGASSTYKIPKAAFSPLAALLVKL